MPRHSRRRHSLPRPRHLAEPLEPRCYFDDTAPIATLDTDIEVVPGQQTFSFDVLYGDDVAVKRATLGPGDVQLVGSDGSRVNANFLSASSDTDAPILVGTYSLPVPVKLFDRTPSVTYHLEVVPTQVTDSANQPITGDPNLGPLDSPLNNAQAILGTGPIRSITVGDNAQLQLVATQFDQGQFYNPLQFPPGAGPTLRSRPSGQTYGAVGSVFTNVTPATLSANGLSVTTVNTQGGGNTGDPTFTDTETVTYQPGAANFRVLNTIKNTGTDPYTFDFFWSADSDLADTTLFGQDDGTGSFDPVTHTVTVTDPTNQFHLSFAPDPNTPTFDHYAEGAFEDVLQRPNFVDGSDYPDAVDPNPNDAALGVEWSAITLQPGQSVDLGFFIKIAGFPDLVLPPPPMAPAATLVDIAPLPTNRTAQIAVRFAGVQRSSASNDDLFITDPNGNTALATFRGSTTAGHDNGTFTAIYDYTYTANPSQPLPTANFTATLLGEDLVAADGGPTNLGHVTLGTFNFNQGSATNTATTPPSGLGPNDVDPTFGNNGALNLQLTTYSGRAVGPVHVAATRVYQSAAQSFSLVLGTVRGASDTGDGDFIAIKLNTTNGAPDPTFGTSGPGFTIIDVGTATDLGFVPHVKLDRGVTDDIAKSLALEQRDTGEILLTGTTQDLTTVDPQTGLVTPATTKRDFALISIDHNGTPDPNFGAGGGATSLNLGSLPNSARADSDDAANAIAIDSFNRTAIVAGGSDAFGAQPGDNDFTLFKFGIASGAADTSFGTAGIRILNQNASDESVNALAVEQTSGNIVAVGRSVGTGFQSGNARFAVARFDQSGNLDTTFGTGGLTSIDFSPTTFDEALAVTITPAAQVLVGGTTATLDNDDVATTAALALARLTPAGQLDPTFARAGLFTLAIPNRIAAITSIELLPGDDARIVLGGITAPTPGASSGSGTLIARLTPNGTLDTTFALGKGFTLLDTTPPAPGAPLSLSALVPLSLSAFAASSQSFDAFLNANRAIVQSIAGGGIEFAATSASGLAIVLLKSNPGLDTQPPALATTLTPLTSPPNTDLPISLTFTDDFAIDPSTFDTNDVALILVTPTSITVLPISLQLQPNGTDGRSYTVTYHFTTPADPNTYTLHLQPNQITDFAARAVPESDLTTVTVTPTVVPPPPDTPLFTDHGTGQPTAADLKITALAFKKGTPAHPLATTPLSGTLAIINTGKAALKGPAKVLFYLSTDDTPSTQDTLLTSLTQSLNLKPGKKATVKFTLTLPAESTALSTTLLAAVNPDGTLHESSTLNNTLPHALTIDPAVTDLGLQSLAVSTTLKRKGGRLKIRLTNTGTLTLTRRRADVAIALSQDQTLSTDDLSLPTLHLKNLTLKPHQSKLITLKPILTAVPANTHATLFATATLVGTPADTNPANDTLFSQSQITIP